MYDDKKGKQKKKCSFKMLLQQWITVEDRQYNLRGIISHIGTNEHLKKNKGEEDTVQEGHFISYRRYGDYWYCFNDDIVFEVQFAQVGEYYETENVYMLLYEKK